MNQAMEEGLTPTYNNEEPQFDLAAGPEEMLDATMGDPNGAGGYDADRRMSGANNSQQNYVDGNGAAGESRNNVTASKYESHKS